MPKKTDTSESRKTQTQKKTYADSKKQQHNHHIEFVFSPVYVPFPSKHILTFAFCPYINTNHTASSLP